MRAKTFQGGVHLHYHKEATASKPIVEMPEPKQVILPVQQHIGAPAEVCVQVGDEVKIGDVVAKAKGFVSASVHASIAGKVTAVGPMPHPGGRNVMAVTIENDGSGATSFAAGKELDALSGDELKQLMQDIGLVGMGGGGVLRLLPGAAAARQRAGVAG